MQTSPSSSDSSQIEISAITFVPYHRKVRGGQSDDQVNPSELVSPDQSIAAITSIGSGMRDNQEDGYLIYQPSPTRLYIVVADGIGGYPGGEIASRCIIDGFEKTSLENLDLDKGIDQIRVEMFEALKEDPLNTSHMGSAYFAALIDHQAGQIVTRYQGNCRLLIFNMDAEHSKNFISREHTFLQDVRDSGEEPSEGFIAYWKHYITNSIGFVESKYTNDEGKLPTPECIPIDSNFRAIFGSDGLFDLLSIEEMRLLSQKAGSSAELRDALRMAVEDKIIAAGGKGDDNITIVVYTSAPAKTTELTLDQPIFPPDFWTAD